MAKKIMPACSRTSKIVLVVLLGVAVVMAVAAVFMPQVREMFTSAESSKGDSVLLIYASWCGHCKQLMQPDGVWDTVKARMSGVKFVEADESDPASKAAIASYQPKGFPTILALKDGAVISTFNGDRDVDSIMNWVSDNVDPTLMQ